jgi:hypothetical protein
VCSKADRRKELFRMTVLRRMSPEEIRWLIRIIMKGVNLNCVFFGALCFDHFCVELDLKIGVKHEQMLKWLYPAPKGQQDALELWNCRTDLEEGLLILFPLQQTRIRGSIFLLLLHSVLVGAQSL